jgi:hypothetical protein
MRLSINRFQFLALRRSRIFSPGTGASERKGWTLASGLINKVIEKICLRTVARSAIVQGSGNKLRTNQQI